jgi:peptidoglycan-N-acetylglucosamine deacetylase
VLRSRASQILVALAALCAVVVAVVLIAGGGAEERSAKVRAGAGDRAAAPRADRPVRPARRRRITEAQAIERVRRITPWVTQGHTHRKLVALTFDDGPGPLTPALMAELRRLRAPATFFQVAQMVDQRPGVARREHKPPFAVGSHTASHARLSRIGPGAQAAEIAGGAKAIDRNSGTYPRLFRPPYGAWNQATVKELRRHRMLMVLWSVTSRDWTSPGTPAIASKVIREVRPGGIVLMHDFGGITREPTLRAVPRIVHALRRKGYRFVTVPDMMRLAPPRRRPPRPASPYPA